MGSLHIDVLSLITLIYSLIAGWTWDSLQGWGAFMKLALPGMFMVCLEWWCFEIGTLLSGELVKSNELSIYINNDDYCDSQICKWYKLATIIQKLYITILV